jgi:rhodanese-related sulfurtransferase
VTATTLPAPPPTGTIDAHELREQMADVRVLDVRTAGEFETQHIPGAYHVPLDTLGEHCPDICGVDAQVVLVCHSGQRARQAATTLAQAGMTSLRVLDGGMAAWTAAGGEVVRGTPRWSLERQVRLVAGGVVLASILVSTRLPRAKWLAGGIGGGLTFAALSDTCAMGNLLARLPYNRSGVADVAATVEALVRDRPAPAGA